MQLDDKIYGNTFRIACVTLLLMAGIVSVYASLKPVPVSTAKKPAVTTPVQNSEKPTGNAEQPD